MNHMHMEWTSSWRRVGTGLMLALALSGCGGGGDEVPPDENPPALPGGEFTVTGVVIGLEPGPMTVTLSGTRPDGTRFFEEIQAGNGPFAFASPVPAGSDVDLVASPGSLTPVHACRPTSPVGFVEYFDWGREPRVRVPRIQGDLSPLFVCGPGHRLSGTATGRASSASGAVSLDLYADGQRIGFGGEYVVDLPGPWQTHSTYFLPGEAYEVRARTSGCRVTNGTGVMPDHDVEGIQVHCGIQRVQYEVIGLVGTGLQVTLASQPAAPGAPPVQETRSHDAPGADEFEAGLSEGDPYAVTVTTAPSNPSQECTVESGTGTVGPEDVTNVVVRCEDGLQREWAFYRHNELAHSDSAERGVVYAPFEMPEFAGLARNGKEIGNLLGVDGLDLYDNLFHLPGTNMAVFSNETGKTYWIATEAATGQTERTTELVTRWWLRKDGDDAKFTLQITDIWLDAVVDSAGRNTLYAHDGRMLRSSAEVSLAVAPLLDGSTEPGLPVFFLHDTVSVTATPDASGAIEDFRLAVLPDSQAFNSIFSEADFDNDKTWGTRDRRTGSTKVSLRHPIDIDVDLSSVRNGQRVAVIMYATVRSKNAYSAEGHTVAYFRDPAQFDPGTSDGGVSVTQMSGLTLVQPGTLPAGYTPLPAATPAPACTVAGAPRAQLQFGAATYRMSESDLDNQDVTITRTGSTAGDVTARVRMAAGTATAGVDFTAREFFVRFPDGQSAPRGIVLPLIDDTLIEGPETLQLSLEDVSGCADLGTQANATVTLLDDEVSTPPPPVGMDTSFDGDGKVALPGVGFDGGTGLALQADGKILIAGGGSRDFVRTAGFVLARFHADGRLDTGFGTGGVLLTAIPDHSVRATQRVAVQPDGKIVVAGFAAGAGSQHFPVLVRYLADGSPDPGFGAGGVVVATTPGTVYALALMPDGRIVVAGSTLLGGPTDFADVVVRRYLPDGAPDHSFGVAGLAVIDVAGKTNEAKALVLLPDGGVIAAGQAGGTADTAVVKLTPQGQPDPAFGSGGVRDLAGLAVGAGLARDADGKLLLVGNDGGSPSRFAMLRLLPDGTTDRTFGNAGLVTTTTSSGPHFAHAVAVGSNGRILVAGEGGVNRDFVLARYFADGSPDPSFNGTGAIVADFDLQHDIAKALVIQPDGRIVLGGTATVGVDTGFALVRVMP